MGVQEGDIEKYLEIDKFWKEKTINPEIFPIDMECFLNGVKYDA